MSSRKLTILLLLALLALSTYSLDIAEEHKCSHDSIENPAPEFTEIDEDFNVDGDNNHEGRTLASYHGLRTYAHYSLNSGSTLNNYISQQLIPPILDYLKGALKVKYPVNGNLRFSGSSLCGVGTPSALRNGVAADMVWVVTTDSSSSYVANSYTCNMASGTHRPLAGRTKISSRFVRATSDVLVHEKNMVCMMHEVTHILGFARSMYGHWIDSNGRTLKNHVKSAVLDGLTSIVIDVPAITNRLKKHFRCDNIKGAYMENTGGSATGGSHFERRHFGMEAMTSGLLFQQDYSEFSLAMMESTGWFVPDYSYADMYFWGKYQGCSFLSGKCTSSLPNWCSSSARACTHPGRGGGSCGSDSRSDGCKFIRPSESYDCENSGAKNYARLPSLQQFGRSSGAKCFSGTLSTSSGASQTTYCFKPTCKRNGNSYSLTLNVGGKSVTCSRKGQVSISGYKGYINCPDPYIFCTSVGAPVCPRGCMGRGSCVSGICKCNKGFTGKDCALKA